MGGTYCFFSQLTDITLNGKKDKVEAIRINREKEVATDVLVLAIGHSARDTFPMLQEAGLMMEAKAFAVGFRVEHPQAMIDACQYNGHKNALLPAASYKLTANLENHRGVYSFCMCPGGYVVNASSEEGMLAVNGMSYHARAGQNANSAIIISVRPDDFEGDGPLAGIEFQRKLEKMPIALETEQFRSSFTEILKRIAYPQDMGLLKVPQRVHIHLQISGKFFQKN